MTSHATGRVLGLDAGERRIGVAISDPDRHLAVPLRSVITDGHGGELDALATLVHDEEVAEVVVGLPLSLSGGESAQTARARAFGATLEQRLSLPVHFWDERLSTQEALHQVDHGRHRSGKRGDRPRGGGAPAVDMDAIAASIILQAYLDHERFAGGGGLLALRDDWDPPLMRLHAPNGPELLQGILAVIVVAVASWIIATSPDDLPRRGETLPVFVGGDPVLIKVEAGDGAGKIGDRLEQSGVIDNAASFQRLARISGSERGLAAGEYEFLPGTSVLDALVRIRSGLTASRIITVPEGLRIEEVAGILERRGVIKGSDFLLAASVFNGGQGVDPLLIGARQPGASLEGYLYPATYSFGRSVRPDDVVLMMVKAMSERFTPALREEAKVRGLSVPDVLTLASIVQREAGHLDDMPLIASVFHNRIKQNMPLQADPTVQYALVPPGGAPKTGTSYWKPDLSADDLKLNSLYNTYVRPGLPPTPIASPSIESIIAVIRPATTNYLYFLAKPDGTLVLSSTFEEHERNVARYLR